MSDIEDRARTYIMNYAERTLDRRDLHQMFFREVMEDAWPPTGEQDQRLAGHLGVGRGELAGLALALGGNRPDPGQTTAQRAEKAFNEHWGKDREFRVYFRPQDGAYEVHRIK